MAKPAHPLDVIRVAAPCSAAWSEMEGDDRVRHCGGCEKRVYNLSELSQEEASDLVTRHEGKLCVRFYRQRDGTVLTADCVRGRWRRARRRMAFAAGAAVAALVGLAPGASRASQHIAEGLAQALTDSGGGDLPAWVSNIRTRLGLGRPQVVMGEVAPMNPPAGSGNLTPLPPTATQPVTTTNAGPAAVE